MVDTGTSPPTINSILSGLKFFFDVTLGHAELMIKVQPVHQPRPLPVMLSCDEVARLIAAVPNPKYQAELSVASGTGLRASEVCALKITDIDSERMTLRVEQGNPATIRRTQRDRPSSAALWPRNDHRADLRSRHPPAQQSIAVETANGGQVPNKPRGRKPQITWRYANCSDAMARWCASA